MRRQLYLLFALCLVLPAGPVPAQQYAPALPPPPLRGLAPGLQSRLVSSASGVRTYVLVFHTGDEIMSGLSEFAGRVHLRDAHFTGIGAVSRATLGVYDLHRKQYLSIPVSSQSEVLSLMGDIALDKGRPAVHVHITLGYTDGTAHGGHLLNGIVSPTLEVFVTDYPAALHKRHDSVSGLDLIDPSKK